MIFISKNSFEKKSFFEKKQWFLKKIVKFDHVALLLSKSETMQFVAVDRAQFLK